MTPDDAQVPSKAMELGVSIMKRIFVAIVLGVSISSASAATVNISPSKDATIFSSGGVNGLGDLFSGSNGGLAPPDERRVLTAFDLSGIPFGVTIDNVSLTFTILRSQGTVTGSLHRLLQDWAEGDQAGMGTNGGQPSAPAGGNDVTWTVTGMGSNWTSPGADFVGPASDSAAIPAFGTVTFTSAGMAADVQGWVDGSFSNFGWLLTGSVTQQNVRKLASGEAVSGQPQLSVTYSVVPVPATALLFGSALALLGLRRRKAA